jgi:hypothetical protein
MRVLEIVEVQLQWPDLENLTYHERPKMTRNPGVHVSDVLRHVAIKHKTYTEEDRDDDMPLRVLLGLAFEESAARLYAGMIWQPGQIEVDGVTGSPDGLSVLDVDGVGGMGAVDEFKYTGKSQRVKGGGADELKDIRTEWSWMQQGMSYLNLLRRSKKVFAGMRLCRFHICWKYGNYVRPYAEKYMRYLVEFEEAELRGNWAMLQTYKGALGGE